MPVGGLTSPKASIRQPHIFSSLCSFFFLLCIKIILYLLLRLFCLPELHLKVTLDLLSVLLPVVEPHTRAYSRIVYHFGPEILLEDGKIDRQKLGQLIFACEEKRRLLNSITHPEIHKAMLKEILFYFLKGERLRSVAQGEKNETIKIQ